MRALIGRRSYFFNGLIASSLILMSLGSELHSFSAESADEQDDEKEVMVDGTISYKQPASEPRFEIEGYEGKCGQTALANFCRMLTDEKSYTPSHEKLAELTEDETPGVHPSTLVKAANELCGQENKYSLKNAEAVDPLRDLSFTTQEGKPAMVLLNWDQRLDSMHWVTVVLVEEDKVVFNHWGTQVRMDAKSFLSKWGSDGCSVLEKSIIDNVFKCGNHPYVSIELKEETDHIEGDDSRDASKNTSN